MYQQLVKLYEQEGMSLRALAKKFGVSHTQIKRVLEKAGCQLRDLSDAQANFLKKNPDKHPTKGKPRTEEEKLKISKCYTKYLEPEERERRKRVAKERWDKKTDEEKEVVRKKTFNAFRSTTKYGSALEKHLISNLSVSGFQPEFHKEFVIENEKMHIDIFLPVQNIAIEVDGPSHYSPIFGPESLQKTQDADTQKNGLLLAKDITVIRVKHITGKLNKYKKHILLQQLKEEIAKNPVGQLIYLEV